MHYSEQKNGERVLLVGAHLASRRGAPSADGSDALDELRLLAESAGGCVVGELYQKLRRIDPATYIGKGKVVEMVRYADELNVKTILFDMDLTPAQSRSLQQRSEKVIVDRTGLIMDIFARNARTREARTQVELAQLQYLLPRLSGMWKHFTRHAGGIGLRGPGESQLEIDRRLIRRRIGTLSADLEKIARQGAVRRRRRQQLARIALVGYTNAGKSTLMNALTGADVPVENRLFKTLDSTTRRLRFPHGRMVLLSDTVGFIRNIPHALVASFQSTLAEAREADMLLHVVDISHSQVDIQIQAVEEVLGELGIGDTPCILVLNKVDRLKDGDVLQRFNAEHPQNVAVSASRGIGITRLLAACEDSLKETLPQPAEIPFLSGTPHE